MLGTNTLVDAGGTYTHSFAKRKTDRGTDVTQTGHTAGHTPDTAGFRSYILSAIESNIWRGGRVADGSGLENQYRRKTVVSSNLTLSAIKVRRRNETEEIHRLV